MNVDSLNNYQNIPQNYPIEEKKVPLQKDHSKVAALYYQTLCPTTPSKKAPTPKLLSSTLLSRIGTHFTLTKLERMELQTQIESALVYLEDHRDELIAAQKDQYLKPQDYKRQKFGKLKAGGLYTGCHIQVSKEGDIIIIPKHRCLSLGNGTSKTVRLGFNLETGKFIAAQSIKGDPAAAMQEIDFLKKMGVDLAYVSFGPKTKAALPLAEQRDLTLHLPALQADPKRRVKVIRGCIDRIAEQHQIGLVNRDIKPANFLLAANDEVYCFDLGLADKNESGVDKFKGTSLYLAPEVFASFYGQGDPDLLGPAVDIYALGITLHILESGNGDDILPWLSIYTIAEWHEDSNLGKFAVDDYWVDWKLHTIIPDVTDYFAPNNIEELILWMTHPDSEQRPTIKQVQENYRRLTASIL